MKSLLLFFVICVSSCELITDATVEVYYDTLGAVYLNYEYGFLNRIVNPEDFELSAGYGMVTFEINNHDITLLHYNTLPEKEEKETTTGYSPIYGKTLYVGVLRGAQRKDPTVCTPVFRAREYVRYVELGMRIWSANQFRISQGNDLYVSSKCLVINESLYVDASYGPVVNALWAEANKIDKVPQLAVRWYITDDYLGSWMGLAPVGSLKIVMNRRSNYWLMCKFNPSVDDPTNRKLATIMHEFGHSCGLGHGGKVASSVSGIFTTFTLLDNYYDCANIMGNCALWDRPITAAQYWEVIVQKKPEPWEFIFPDEGTHKYRLYAFDHPYTRYFLGTNQSFHNPNEVFDGIPFKYNCLAIRVLVNKTLTSKYKGADSTSGSIMFEYRFNPAGQQGAQDFGVRITYGFGNKGNLLMANMDHLQSWADSEIIPNVDYYPSDFDTGTLRVRVLKLHRPTLKESIEKEIVKETKRNYDEPSYAELEIEFFPNKKYTPPKVNGLPNFIFSPSFYNCKKNNDESGYSCSKSSSTNSGWYYFINNGNRDRNTPRYYTNKNAFMKARLSIRSYNGWDFSNSKVCYGDSGIKCINITVAKENYPGYSRKNYQNAKVTRYRLNDANKTVEDLGNNNLLFGTGLEIPEGGRAFITDLFGNEKELKIVDKSFAELLPPLETDGFGEGGVVVKDKDGKVTYYNGFTFYNPVNENRVAIKYNDNGEIELSPAVTPNNRFTTTTMLYSITIKSSNWFTYPIINLAVNDYVLIDFKGNVPNDLVMTIETDMGEYSKDLSELGGLNSVSYKLTYKEINKATGGWGEIDRFKFNKDVEIQNIRPIYMSKVGNQIVKINAEKGNFNFNGYRYTIETTGTEAKYIYKKVNVEINGESYSFDTSTSTESVKSIGKKGLSTFVIVLIIIAVVVVLIGLIFIIFKMKSKNSGSSRSSYPPRAVGFTGGYRR